MTACDRHVSCRLYARLCPNRTAGATGSLSARMPQDVRAGKRRPENQPLMANLTPLLGQERIGCSPPNHIPTRITKMSFGKRAPSTTDPAGYGALRRYNDCVTFQID
jgi:hypothetical protein